MSEMNPQKKQKLIGLPVALMLAFSVGLIAFMAPQIGVASPIHALEEEQDEARLLLGTLPGIEGFRPGVISPLCDIRKDCSDSTMTISYAADETSAYRACLALYNVSKEHLLTSYALYRSGTIYNGENTLRPNASIAGYRLSIKSKGGFTKNCTKTLNKYGGKVGMSRVYVYETGNATAVPAIKYAQILRYQNELHLEIMATYRGIALDGFLTTERYLKQADN